MLKTTTLTVAILVMFQLSAFADSVYVWTDDKGVKHYSNTGPSEITEDYQKEEELPPDPSSAAASRVEPSEPPPSQASPDDSVSEAPPPADDAKDPEADYLESQRLSLDDFPMQQGALVQREKTIVADLQDVLAQPDVKREDIIERERKRLLFAIGIMEQAPLEKFGSQGNKRRQVGYMKYRIEELNDDPDAYFKYHESDTD
jgi:hypothetical protein